MPNDNRGQGMVPAAVIVFGQVLRAEGRVERLQMKLQEHVNCLSDVEVSEYTAKTEQMQKQFDEYADRMWRKRKARRRRK